MPWNTLYVVTLYVVTFGVLKVVLLKVLEQVLVMSHSNPKTSQDKSIFQRKP
jgi:hypothetical protein